VKILNTPVRRACLAAACAALLALAALVPLAFRGPALEFDSPAACAAWARARGLHVSGDDRDAPYAVLVSASGDFAGSTFLAPAPGVVTVLRLHPSTPRPSRAYRLWGGVVAYGDEALLAHCEGLR
jgi:hypothetical protein